MVDSIFEFNPFALLKLILSRSKVYESLYYFLIFYSITSGTNSVAENRNTKIPLAPKGSQLNDTLFDWSYYYSRQDKYLILFCIDILLSKSLSQNELYNKFSIPQDFFSSYLREKVCMTLTDGHRRFVDCHPGP